MRRVKGDVGKSALVFCDGVSVLSTASCVVNGSSPAVSSPARCQIQAVAKRLSGSHVTCQAVWRQFVCSNLAFCPVIQGGREVKEVISEAVGRSATGSRRDGIMYALRSSIP